MALSYELLHFVVIYLKLQIKIEKLLLLGLLRQVVFLLDRD